MNLHKNVNLWSQSTEWSSVSQTPHPSSRHGDTQTVSSWTRMTGYLAETPEIKIHFKLTAIPGKLHTSHLNLLNITSIDTLSLEYTAEQSTCIGGQRPVRLEGSIRLSRRLSLSFSSNNNPLTVLLEMDGEAQLKIEWDLRIRHRWRSLLMLHWKHGAVWNTHN